MTLGFFIRRLAWAVGAMDFFTGLGLVTMPELTLRCMLVPIPGAEALLFVRFVGAFVTAVGAVYLWGALGPSSRLKSVIACTLAFRGSAGGFCSVAVAVGSLPPGWLAVAVVDLSLLVLQIWILRKESW